MYSKDEKERNILKLIYDENNFELVLKSEEPDFKLKYKSDNVYFGVEITEMYFNESNARLRNISNYFEDIMDRRAYRHKKDKDILKIEEISLLSESNSDGRTVEAIVQSIPTNSKYLSLLDSIIVNKDKKHLNYDSSLKHINLVIYDTENSNICTSVHEFTAILSVSDLFTTMFNTSFREVFLVTRVEDGEKYFPLKLIIYISKLFELNEYINSDLAMVEATDDDIMFCASYLYKIGMKNLYFIENERIELIWSGYGFIINDDLTVTIRQYNDFTIPKESKIFDFNKHGVDVFNSQVLNSINKHSYECTFRSGFGFNVIKKNQFKYEIKKR